MLARSARALLPLQSQLSTSCAAFYATGRDPSVADRVRDSPTADNIRRTAGQYHCLVMVSVSNHRSTGLAKSFNAVLVPFRLVMFDETDTLIADTLTAALGFYCQCAMIELCMAQLAL
eukprot:GHRR01034040.1.p2 GENE.GHRR01034040.1~~GHRR01034040.1.p2  ORF type:complete len:118 (-),score=8.61 GHRR01034040.1:867-1220(-)